MGLADWRAAVELVDDARSKREILRNQYGAALDAWEVTMRGTCGALLGLGLTPADEACADGGSDPDEVPLAS